MNCGNIAPVKKNQQRKASNALLRSIANIRHTAVHHLRVSEQSLDKLFAGAKTLLRLLGEDQWRAEVYAPRQEVQLPMSASHNSDNLPRRRGGETLRVIAIKRGHGVSTKCVF